MEEIVARIGISKGSASQGLRQLEELGAVAARGKVASALMFTPRESNSSRSSLVSSTSVWRLASTSGAGRLQHLEELMPLLPANFRPIARLRLQRITKWHKRAQPCCLSRKSCYRAIESVPPVRKDDNLSLQEWSPGIGRPGAVALPNGALCASEPISTSELQGPCLSVIMPVYNEEQTLGEIIEAVLRQPLVAQLICVDDCSVDGTRAILEEHAKADPRLKVLRHTVNRGKGAALRTGIAEATAPIVVIQDADLEYDPKEYPKTDHPHLGGACRCCLRLAIYRFRGASRPLLLALNRKQAPDFGLKHVHQSQSHRHGNLLQDFPPGDHSAH